MMYEDLHAKAKNIIKVGHMHEILQCIKTLYLERNPSGISLGSGHFIHKQEFMVWSNSTTTVLPRKLMQ